ncbi:MAG: pyridoxine 5'-phosphate synthase [Gammaproteobacteria bacterium]|jgi:pyridoxine 5-phosphate synthase|nr:pyridoxine 5'-phosphate synthase [Gammaproteobacteria bacterium]NCW08697.1 pyridoxine 5'-phosphate synthase [Gammaproteobacteria bacterium]NCW73361.1 pyridoxine 5'-phosphate synthase [Gammaproteobacteria bacterium]NCX48926.1 pyridoxine 5'-phosphate synthase [Gammaproteobacteria bacterium]
MNQYVRLGVNIDHVATLRNARGGQDPHLLQMALAVEEAGADGITIHLREDRRHIRDEDVWLLRSHLRTPMNLEMAATDEMVRIALKAMPKACCIVPEHRREVTTEGGLNVVGQLSELGMQVAKLSDAGIEVSLFIDADRDQIQAAHDIGAPVIELHTGEYANASTPQTVDHELERLEEASAFAQSLGLVVNAGHGLTKFNVAPIAAIEGMNELNIGHSLIARSLMVGLPTAVREFREIMDRACQ